MLRIGDPAALVLRVAAPQDKDQRIRMVVQLAHDLVGEFFPPPAAVGQWFGIFDRQHGVHQKHALLSPFHQIAVMGNRTAQIVMQFLININETWRYLDALTH